MPNAFDEIPEPLSRRKVSWKTHSQVSFKHESDRRGRVSEVDAFFAVYTAQKSSAPPKVVARRFFFDVPLEDFIALTRLTEERRDAFLNVCRGLSDALLVLVQWVLGLAPIGVFALAVGLGTKMGASSAGALLHYVLTLSAILFVFTLCLYPVAAILGRVSLRRFATAALPAQAAAFSARSSIAALPAMIAAVRDDLVLNPRMSGFVLPLAVSVFRLNVPIAWVVGLLFLGKLYGITLGASALVTIVLTATLLSFSVPGLPSASLFLLSPVLAQHGIPVEGVGILIALDAIPDMFKTLANVTAHLTSAVVLDRVDRT